MRHPRSIGDLDSLRELVKSQPARQQIIPEREHSLLPIMIRDAPGLLHPKKDANRSPQVTVRLVVLVCLGPSPTWLSLCRA
jgi:hypothetical protein